MHMPLNHIKNKLLFLMISAGLVTKTFVFDFVKIRGDSMSSSFLDNEICMNIKAYRNINRYDVVIARAEKMTLVKRVIGIPGDIIIFSGNSVFINENRIDPKYDFPTVSTHLSFKVGRDEYFLLGDNRNHSLDSRKLGCFKRRSIIGRAVKLPGIFGNLKE